MNAHRSLLACLPLLLSCAGRPTPHQPPASEAALVRTPWDALARILAVVDTLPGEGQEIRLRRVDSARDAAPDRPGTVTVKLDLDFLASDALEATRLQERFVQALREGGATGWTGARSSHALDTGGGVSCDSFQVEFPALAATRTAAPTGDGESRIRSTAVRDDIRLGQLDIRKRLSDSARGTWLSFQIEPAQRRAAYPLAKVLRFAEALGEGPDALFVTEIRLRPGDRIAPGAETVQTWTFEVEAGRPQA